MKIYYKSKKLEKNLNEPRNMVKKYGILAKKINQRLSELKAAYDLEVMKTIPAARCHELKENRKGQFAVDVSGKERMVFIPDHDPIPKLKDGGIDWTGITEIIILGIEDYHQR